jgi:hypothetical protein
MRNLTIFALPHGAHSCAKIHFAVGEKDESAQTAANEFIRAFAIAVKNIYNCIATLFNSTKRGTQNERF